MKNETMLRGGEFLVKSTDSADVFIPEERDEDQQEMYNSVVKFLEKEIHPRLNEIDNKEEGLMVSLLKKVADLGLLGMAVPEEYGGFGKDFITNMFITEATGSGHSFSVALAAHTGIGTLPIVYFGTAEQKQKYLPRLANGEAMACYCLTEPGSGSDALAAKTKAILSEDKKNYLLNGQKMWITNAGFADIFIVFAQVDGDKFTGFIVEKGFPGLSLGEEEHKMGIKGSSTRQVFFGDCLVPANNVLGKIGEGHKIAFNILNIGRAKLAGAALGGAKRVCALSVKYATERAQFGQPIAQFGAIQHKLAEQAIRIYACESALYRLSDNINKAKQEFIQQGKDGSDALLLAAEEYAIECAVIKVFGSEMLDFIVDEGVQIHGGYGFSADYPMDRAYRDSRINRIFEGTNEINRLLIFDMLMKRAMKGKIDLMGPALAIQKELMSVPVASDAGDSTFAAERAMVDGFKKAALMAAGATAQKLMSALKTEQEIMMHLSDILIECYVCESLLLRTEKIVAKSEKGKCDGQISMMRVFLNDAGDRINASAKNAICGWAQGDELKMLMMGLKRFLKATPYNTKEARRSIAAKVIESGKYCF